MKFKTTLDYINYTIYDVVDIDFGKIHFKTVLSPSGDPNWTLPPMMRGGALLDDATKSLFDAYYGGNAISFTNEEILDTGKPISGRIMGRSVDLKEGLITFEIEIENIRSENLQSHLGLWYTLTDYVFASAATSPGSILVSAIPLLPDPYAISDGQGVSGNAWLNTLYSNKIYQAYSNATL